MIFTPAFICLLTLTTSTVMVIVLLLLLAISFLISGSEVAFFSMTRKDIVTLRNRDNPSFKRIADLLQEPKSLLASMLISNALLNMGIILISNILLSQYLPSGDWRFFLIKLIIISSGLVLIGEVLPKVWATHHKVGFAANASFVVELATMAFSGLSNKFVRLNRRMENKLLGIDLPGTQTDPGLDAAIDHLPEEEATIEEKVLLKGIRKFGDIEVKQIMRTRMDVHGLSYNFNFLELKEKIEELHYSRLPVYKSNLDEIAGIIHAKDILPYLDKESDFDWHQLMRQPFFVHEKKYIEDLLVEFRNKRIHFAVVVDEFGGTSGIVTLEDIIEEVVGDIKDEFDEEENTTAKIDDNNYIFEGKTMISDVCRTMGLQPGHFDNLRGESESLGGLLLEIAGEIPKENDQFIIDEFIFTPTQMNKNRIEKVSITIQHPTQ